MIDFKNCFNIVEKHIEDRYQMPVHISDVLDPNTGDFDGVTIKIDYDQELDLAFYILLHLFGHSVQWNLSKKYRDLGQDQTIPKPPEVMQEIYLSLIHISEPTRPLYISYAVFCLKKKN